VTDERLDVLATEILGQLRRDRRPQSAWDLHRAFLDADFQVCGSDLRFALDILRRNEWVLWTGQGWVLAPQGETA
jgi:hypothetical protein